MAILKSLRRIPAYAGMRKTEYELVDDGNPGLRQDCSPEHVIKLMGPYFL